MERKQKSNHDNGGIVTNAEKKAINYRTGIRLGKVNELQSSYVSLQWVVVIKYLYMGVFEGNLSYLLVLINIIVSEIWS